MKQFKKTIALFFAATVLISSCKKDEDDDNNNPSPNNQPTTVTPNIADGNGTLVAIKTKTTSQTPIGPMDTFIGTAVAVFFNDGNYDAFVDAGTVKVNNNSLSKQGNNSYVAIPGVAQPMGINFDNEASWEVSGAGSIGSFSHQDNTNFPTLGNITSAESITKSAGYTLTCSTISNADSVFFAVGGVIKTLAGNASSCEFTSAELASVPSGQSYVQVAPYSISNSIYGGKRYYFVKESVTTKLVTVN